MCRPFCGQEFAAAHIVSAASTMDWAKGVPVRVKNFMFFLSVGNILKIGCH
jgi:hypothetical protein